MKVAFYMTTVLEYYGGMEKWVIDTSIELQKRYPDLDITIITRDNSFTEKLNKVLASLKGYKYNRDNLFKESYEHIQKKLDNIPYIKMQSFGELRKKLSEYDVVYSKNEILEASIFKFIIGYKHIKKIIFGCHTALYYPYGRLHNILYTTKIYTFLTSGVHIFQVLNSTDESVLNKLNKQVIRIENPINEQNILQNAQNYDFDIISTKNSYNIAWIGRLTKQKGIDTLIKIAEYIRKNYDSYPQKVHLHIAGSGENKNDILVLQEKYSFIHYYGHIENYYIPSFLKDMNLLIHTSLWEAYGLTIIEANILNIPVLAFDIPGPKDIIRNGGNGFLASNNTEYCQALQQCIFGEKNFSHVRESLLKEMNDDTIYNKLYTLLTQ